MKTSQINIGDYIFEIHYTERLGIPHAHLLLQSHQANDTFGIDRFSLPIQVLKAGLNKTLEKALMTIFEYSDVLYIKVVKPKIELNSVKVFVDGKQIY